MTTFKRKVFYLGGFDPRGVRFYHGLYREAAARWSALSGQPLSVSRRRRIDASRSDWQVANEADGSQTSYSFLGWEDIVRQAWIRNPAKLMAAGVRTYWGHWRHLDRAWLRRLPTPPLRTLVYPPIAFPLVTLVVALLLALPLGLMLPWWAALALALAGGAAASGPILARFHMPWLLRFFIFNAEQGGGESDPILAARLDAFASAILAELDEDWDEVLLITHSNGSILSVPLMHRLLARRGGILPDRFALVTLGQCIPLVAYRRDATVFRSQLTDLAAGDFRWIDIGSPPDAAGFHGVNAMAAFHPSPRPRLEMLSPRFHLFYEKANYHSGLMNKYEIHFDYLRVGDRPSPLDYPAITAAAGPIADKIAAFRALDA
jgi:hypothetical protein